MKVNYQDRIEASTTELKIIMNRQKTVTIVISTKIEKLQPSHSNNLLDLKYLIFIWNDYNCQKVQALYLLKSGKDQSITIRYLNCWEYIELPYKDGSSNIVMVVCQHY